MSLKIKKYEKILNLLITLCICTKLFSQVNINSYHNPSITSKGVFGENQNVSEIIISPIIMDDKIAISKDNGTYKFAEPKFVNISPLSQAFEEVFDNDIIYRLKIVAQNAASITISFDRLILSKNAEIYIYNPEGTVVTGSITANENIGKGRFWSSNSFQGNSVIVEVKIPKNEKKDNDLHIGKILFGLTPKTNLNLSDSVAFGHFNFFSSCNINVLCPEGNAWADERKGICLIETDDGGAYTGTLVNSACDNNVPYLLTAWHCTNGRNPYNWTYIFGWWSSTCASNTFNQQGILFNGATLRATYEPTDFSLLELFQTPASNSGLTYLGWSRSSTIPQSSVGNVRSNTNTAWRVLWNAGTVESGSSGSPLFDPNHKIIGQLYSST